MIMQRLHFNMPLNSITEEWQIWEANGFTILTVSLVKLSVVKLKSVNFQLLFGLAESVLDGKFLSVMQVLSFNLKHYLSYFTIVDETNVMEMWTSIKVKYWVFYCCFLRE